MMQSEWEEFFRLMQRITEREGLDEKEKRALVESHATDLGVWAIDTLDTFCEIMSAWGFFK